MRPPSPLFLRLHRRLRKFLARDIPPDIESEMEMLLEELLQDAGGSILRRQRVYLLAVVDLVRHYFSGRENVTGTLDDVRQDLRHAARGFVRRPVLSATVVVTLALGVGANTAIFSVVRSTLLKPLPFPEVETLVRLGESDPTEQSFVATSMPNYMEWSAARSFDGMAGYWAGRTVWIGGDRAERVTVARVTVEYFDLIGLRPMLGRTFTPEEHLAEAGVAILTHDFWVRALGADSAVVGRTVELDTGPLIVVGVMGRDVGPSGVPPFHGELVVPMATIEKPVWTRSARFLHVVARLRPGVTLGEARAEMAEVGLDLQRRFPEDNPRSTVQVLSMTDAMMGSAKTSLHLLWGAVGLVMLIASLNIASLLLVQAARRRDEFRVRQALGADRARLVRLAFTETSLLALVGGVVGAGFGWLALRAFLDLAPAGVPRMDEVGLDASALVFTAIVSLLSAGVFGIAPAMTVSRTALGVRTPRGGLGRTPSLLRSAVVVEVSVALVIVFGASVFAESLRSLSSVDPGYDPSPALTAQVTLPLSRYPAPTDRAAFYRQVEERVGALAGVQAATVATLPVPATGGFGVGIRIDDALDQIDGSVFRTGPGFFDVHGIAHVRGRTFDTSDGMSAPLVAIVSESAARALFGNGPALGRRIRLTTHLSLSEEEREIVGVVGDARLYGPSEPVPTAVYIPLDQWSSGGIYITARIAGNPALFVSAMRDAIQEVDPLLPVGSVETLEQALASSYSSPRFYTALLTGFAVIALLLTAAGVFGVLSTAVEQRIREIGVRVALGATRFDVVAWTLRLGMVPALLGIGLGVVGVVSLQEILNNRVPELAAADPLVGSLALGLVLFVTSATCLVAARRATVVDPQSVLRSD